MPEVFVDPLADRSPPCSSSSHPAPRSQPLDWLWIAAAASLALPWLVYRTVSDAPAASPLLVALLAGLAILGAAFLLSWAAEVLQLEVSQALALALLSLIAVLPEYAVDVVFAWRAASDPSQAPYAVANMTGANRLLIGLGWSMVVFVAWWRIQRRRTAPLHLQQALPEQSTPASEARSAQHAGGAERQALPVRSVLAAAGGAGEGRANGVALERSHVLEVAALGTATLYSFSIPLKGGIGLLDTAVLGGMFAVYAWVVARAPAEHPELAGPAAAIARLGRTARRVVTLAFFAYAAAVILASAEPFAEGLVHSGALLGIDEFLLVQWLAPLASEAPEFLVALLFAWKGLAGAGLGTLVASKVNQWTLLIGTLGAAYSLSLGAPANLPLDARQVEELLLTSAQSFFALALIADLRLSLAEAAVLLGAFVLQLLLPGTEVRLAFAGAYMVAGAALFAIDPQRRAALRHLPLSARTLILWGKASDAPLSRQRQGPG